MRELWEVRISGTLKEDYRRGRFACNLRTAVLAWTSTRCLGNARGYIRNRLKMPSPDILRVLVSFSLSLLCEFSWAPPQLHCYVA